MARMIIGPFDRGGLTIADDGTTSKKDPGRMRRCSSAAAQAEPQALIPAEPQLLFYGFQSLLSLFSGLRSFLDL
ncbi:hypothetical protein HJFPF1_08764 [Paramyrothecium foliicola]|nr:hypothetical protein HJFPF1_08764 [Paramyrothecium foliicola]